MEGHERCSNFVYVFYQTIGAAFGAKKITVGNKCVTLGIWVSFNNYILHDACLTVHFSQLIFIFSKYSWNC